MGRSVIRTHAMGQIGQFRRRQHGCAFAQLAALGIEADDKTKRIVTVVARP